MDWSALVLELGLLGLATAVLAGDLFLDPRASRRGLYLLSTAGLVVLLGLSLRLPEQASFGAAWVQDEFALYVKRILLAAGALTVLAAEPHAIRRGYERRSGELLVLLFFSMIGGMALVSAREFLTLFVAFELLSLPVYALAALEKGRPDAPEGALKIFLFGSVSSAALILGLGMLFAATGTTFWTEAAAAPHTGLFELGRILLLVGFGFKIAMFPFYMWVPDTYQSAPTPVVAFISVAPKAAGIAALFRLHFELFAARLDSPTLGWALFAAATMIVGNLLALPQQNLKRLLAYSGVAHIGYVLTALAAGTRFAAGMALFYFVAYLFSNMGAFLALAALEAAGEEPTQHGVRNLIRRSPVLAAVFLVFLLSLGGIPFVLGFWGKLYVFLAAGRAGLWWLVFLGALLAVVALYYYLNVARSMFIRSDEAPALSVPWAILAALIVCAAVVTVGGVFPHLLVDPALRAVERFAG